MAAAGLVLYVVVAKVDMPSCLGLGHLPRRYVGGRDYIGLRERPEDAVARAGLISEDPVDKTTHVLLKIIFSTEGIAHYATTCAGSAHGFAARLYKNTYRGEYDWKVWHFLEDLPLEARSSSGALYIRSEWMEIP